MWWIVINFPLAWKKKAFANQHTFACMKEKASRNSQACFCSELLFVFAYKCMLIWNESFQHCQFCMSPYYGYVHTQFGYLGKTRAVWTEPDWTASSPSRHTVWAAQKRLVCCGGFSVTYSDGDMSCVSSKGFPPRCNSCCRLIRFDGPLLSYESDETFQFYGDCHVWYYFGHDIWDATVSLFVSKISLWT